MLFTVEPNTTDARLFPNTLPQVLPVSRYLPNDGVSPVSWLCMFFAFTNTRRGGFKF